MSKSKVAAAVYFGTAEQIAQRIKEIAQADYVGLNGEEERKRDIAALCNEMLQCIEFAKEEALN